MSDKKLAIIGVGKLGQECGEVLAEHYAVVGYDKAERTPLNFPMAASIDEAVDGADFIFIAVPTPHDPAYGGEKPTSHLPPKDFDYRPLQEVASALARCVRPGQKVVVISTVLPGTMRTKIAPLLPGVDLLYNPYLIAMGSVKWDMKNPEMLIVGSETGDRDGDAQRLMDLYQPLLQNSPRAVVGTYEEAEAVKIFYNTFISAKIGLVNLVLDVAEACGNINVDIVTDALRDSTQRIMGPRYMHAGMGDAGACHPRDNIALRHLAKELDLGYDLFEAIMTSREHQAERIARRLRDIAAKTGLTIVIHGKAYKPLVHYTEGSYSLLIEHFLRKWGLETEFVDPLTGDKRTTSGPAVFLMAHNAEVTYANTGVDATGRPQFYCDIPAGSVVLDPWRKLPPLPGVEVIHYGNTRGAVSAGTGGAAR